MSEQNKSYEQAYSDLVESVYKPVFFSKLASYGIAPADQEEAVMFIQLGQQLRAEKQAEQTKQASSRKGVLKQALNQPVTNNTPVAQIKEAANHLLAQRPELKDAALLYRDYIAQVMTQQK